MNTTPLGFEKPDPGASDDEWGYALNRNFDRLDAQLQDKAARRDTLTDLVPLAFFATYSAFSTVVAGLADGIYEILADESSGTPVNLTHMAVGDGYDGI